MIAKELDDVGGPMDLFGRAGRAAEEQMAHYLRRAYAQADRVSVYNGLRFELDGEVAQIDHLVLHSYGLIIVESKSVSTRVGVNHRGEWARWYKGQWQGMRSPLLQAERQAKFLQGFMKHHKAPQRRKFDSLVGGGTTIPIDIIIAVSDDGIIERPPGFAENTVIKADQVTGRIDGIIAAYRKDDGLLSLKLSSPFMFFKQEYLGMAEFFLQQHVPRSATVASPARPLNSPPAGLPSASSSNGSSHRNRQIDMVCRRCKGHHLTPHDGPYGWYFKCQNCNHNTPMKPPCPACGQQMTTRKKGDQLVADCASCRNMALISSPAAACE
jgi:hypothetical protein